MKSPFLLSLAEARGAVPAAQLVATASGTMRAIVRGKGPPVVLLHGITDNATTWSDVQSRLGDVATTHAIDLAGHGLTDIPEEPLTLTAMARWVADYMDAAGIPDAVVAGWSLGGGVTLGLAAHSSEKVRALVLVGSVGLPMPIPRVLGLLGIPGAAEAMPFLARVPPLRRVLLRENYHPSFRARAETLDQYWSSWRIAGRARYIRALLRSLKPEEMMPWLTTIGAPAWIVHGEHDRLVPIHVGRGLADRLKGARLHVLARTGHCPHIERVDETALAIEDALRAARPDALAARPATR